MSEFVANKLLFILLACIPCALVVGILNKELGIGMSQTVMMVISVIVTFIVYRLLKVKEEGRPIYLAISIAICVILLVNMMMETPAPWIAYVSDVMGGFVYQ